MPTKKKALSVPVDGIAKAIMFQRGQRVILDSDLAAIYGVEHGASIRP